MENEEIDLIEVIAKLWRRRMVVLSFVISFGLVGLSIAFLLPRLYTAKCILGLEVEDNTMRISVEGISALQSMSMGDTKSARVITPSMYPDIFFSVPFQKELIYRKLFINEHRDSLSFYDYFIGLKPGDGRMDRLGTVEQLSENERKCLAYLKKNIEVQIDHKNGYLKISVSMPDALVAAELAQQAQNMLQRYITNFKIAKAQATLDFIEERYKDVKQELDLRQKALIEFREKNKGGISVQSETQENVLNNDYELFFELYSNVVKQREKAKIQVKEDMPVLTVIEPVVLPSASSKPKRGIIVLGALLLGGLIGCGWVLTADALKTRK